MQATEQTNKRSANPFIISKLSGYQKYELIDSRNGKIVVKNITGLSRAEKLPKNGGGWSLSGFNTNKAGQAFGCRQNAAGATRTAKIDSRAVADGIGAVRR